MSCLKLERGGRNKLASIGDVFGQIADRWTKASVETYTGVI